MGRGGGGEYKTGGGGEHVKFYPYEKRGEEKVLAMLKEGRGTTSFEVVLAWVLEVLVIVMGGTKFPPFKRGGHKKFYPVLTGGGEDRKKFATCDFPIL